VLRLENISTALKPRSSHRLRTEGIQAWIASMCGTTFSVASVRPFHLSGSTSWEITSVILRSAGRRDTVGRHTELVS